MSPAVATVVSKLLTDEGGVANVGDGQGITRYGQTPGWLTQWGLPVPTSPEAAAANYDAVWQRTQIADVIEYDETLGFVLATFATHSTETFAIRKLQEELNVDPDGDIGPKTLAALRAAPLDQLTHGLLAEYCELLGRAMSNQVKDNRPFAVGWSKRLSRLIRSLAA